MNQKPSTMKLLKLAIIPILVLLAGQVMAQKPTQAEINASKLITLSNTVITLSNEYNGKFRYYENTLEAGDKKYDELKRGYDNRFPVSFNGGAYPVSPGYGIEYEKALKDLPEAVSEKPAIASAVAKATANVVQLEKWGNSMRSYFVDKYFEQDKLENYQYIRDSLLLYYNETRKAWREAVNLASEAGDNAEMYLLRNDPVAQFLTPMKADLRSLKGMIQEFYEIAGAEETDFSPVDEKITALKSSLDKNKSTAGKDTSVLSHEEYYTSYYEKLEKCTSTLVDFITELKKEEPSGSRLELLDNNLDVYYDEVINGYNNFASYGTK